MKTETGHDNLYILYIWNGNNSLQNIFQFRKYEKDYREKFDVQTKVSDWKITSTPHTNQKDAFNCGIFCLMVRFSEFDECFKKNLTPINNIWIHINIFKVPEIDIECEKTEWILSCNEIFWMWIWFSKFAEKHLAGDFTSLLTITSANLKHMRRVVASKLMESKGKYMKHDYYILALVPIIEL